MNRYLLSVMVLPLVAAQAPPDLDKQYAEMGSRSVKEANKYREEGGRPGGAGDPALQWAETFRKFREDHPGTPAGTRASRMCLTWLRHADQDKEVLARAEKLPVDDPVWATVINGVRDSARKTGQYDRFLRIADSVLGNAKDPGLRAAVYAAMGQSWVDQNKPERARSALESVIEEVPGTPAAKAAQKSLDDILHLAVGKPAPRFEAKTIDGAPISLDDFRGKVIFLNVWATW